MANEWTVASLDVWRNDVEGWDVNDVHELGGVVVDNIDDDESIIDALIMGEYLTEDTRSDNLTTYAVWGDDSTLYIDRKDDGRPLLRLIREVE